MEISMVRDFSQFVGKAFALLVLISSVGFLSGHALAELCPPGPSDENRFLPPPPKFPDFLAIFKASLGHPQAPDLRLLEPDSPGSTPCSPTSVNWSEFNTRLCGADPLNLDEFCGVHPTTEVTEVWSTTMTDQPTTQELVTLKLDTEELDTEELEAEVSSVYTQPLTQGSEDNVASTDSLTYFSLEPTLGEETTSMVEAQRAVDASVAIGLGCSFALIIIILIVSMIAISHKRRVMDRLFKVFQRQTSDARPFSLATSSQPSTPLDEFQPGVMLTNNNVTGPQYAGCNGRGLATFTGHSPDGRSTETELLDKHLATERELNPRHANEGTSQRQDEKSTVNSGEGFAPRNDDLETGYLRTFSRDSTIPLTAFENPG